MKINYSHIQLDCVGFIQAELERSTPDIVFSLETALVVLDQDIDNFEGTNEVGPREFFVYDSCVSDI